MRTAGRILIILVVAGVVSCTKPTHRSAEQVEPSLGYYENELFSIVMPEGWTCDSSGWKGLDSVYNSVDIYNPDGSIVWFHFVKTFFPANWKNITEAKEMSKFARGLSGGDIELLYEVDSTEVGGYPTSILCFANYVDNDTIIQKQFVTFLQDSRIVMYFNENFYVQDWDAAQKLGDMIMSTIEIKKVDKPLRNDSVLKRAAKEGLENHPLNEQLIECIRGHIKEFKYQNSVGG